ncbi:hypothetical protein [Oceanicoccus sp. KOV_DT_Chl]|uniref:hypothetical protein n=1 Tax=Oceanicoccus sp. KOV_DT_Chl TaxID=1904639 RepID=UPI00135B0847|nr:hypothetical protein [Oceanicoccus sp. KOV_DT_Chl]
MTLFTDGEAYRRRYAAFHAVTINGRDSKVISPCLGQSDGVAVGAAVINAYNFTVI